MNAAAAKTRLILQLRAMEVSDLQAVTKTERSAYSLPWSEQNFRDCLSVGYCCLVADYRSIPIGHGIMRIGGDNASLLNLCVFSGYQRRGIGTSILQQLLVIANERYARMVSLEVRPTNTAARRLYERLGFSAAEVRKAFYKDRNRYEDAIIMMMDLGSADWHSAQAIDGCDNQTVQKRS